jgi:predicted glycoside hydrolase/deacetylase ChbG (UPF0249 family)
MVNRPAVAEAVAMARDHPTLGVGLHWDGGGEGAPELDLDDVQLVRDEFQRQLDRFHQLVGRMPTHVDSEAHAHRHEQLMPVFQELVEPLGVPLRHDGRVRFVGSFYAQWYLFVTNLKYVSPPFLEALLREEVMEGWTELSCHPGYLSPRHDSTYNFEREAEVRTLTDARIRRTIEELDIRLASFADYSRCALAVGA